MSYVKPFIRLVVIGTLYGTETFSYSLNYVDADGGGPVAPGIVPDEIMDAVEEYHASPGLIGSQARVTTVKLNLIGTDGRYANDETVLREFDTPVPGAAGAAIAPQIAYAVSLRTNSSRGRGHAGRYYLPVPALAISTTGRLDDVALNVVSGPSIAFVEALNAALPGWRIGVVSPLGSGHERAVTYLRFGRVLDTIRSRRSSLDEGYVDSAPLV